MNYLKFIRKAFGSKKTPQYKKNRFFEFISPDFVFDIGANTGMSAQGYLDSGFKGDIHSFEPVSHLYNELFTNAEKFSNWYAINKAVGNQEKTCTINVSGGHGGASSFYNMTDELLAIAPDQRTIRSEAVEIITLNSYYVNKKLDAKRVFLKIDVQGFEMNVLKGANELFDKVAGIKVETSIIRQYKEETDVFEILHYLLDNGFAVYSFVDGWRNPKTQELLQIDIYLFNREMIISN